MIVVLLCYAHSRGILLRPSNKHRHKMCPTKRSLHLHANKHTHTHTHTHTKYPKWHNPPLKALHFMAIIPPIVTHWLSTGVERRHPHHPPPGKWTRRTQPRLSHFPHVCLFNSAPSSLPRGGCCCWAACRAFCVQHRSLQVEYRYCFFDTVMPLEMLDRVVGEVDIFPMDHWDPIFEN